MITKIPNSGDSNYNNYDSFDYENDYFNDTVNEMDGNFDVDFSEYLWMENEEEFDKSEMQRLEEEALMEQCIEDMMDDELEDQLVDEAFVNMTIETDCRNPCNVFSTYELGEADIIYSTLNPLAQEFIPHTVEFA